MVISAFEFAGYFARRITRIVAGSVVEGVAKLILHWLHMTSEMNGAPNAEAMN